MNRRSHGYPWKDPSRSNDAPVPSSSQLTGLYEYPKTFTDFRSFLPLIILFPVTFLSSSIGTLIRQRATRFVSYVTPFCWRSNKSQHDMQAGRLQLYLALVHKSQCQCLSAETHLASSFYHRALDGAIPMGCKSPYNVKDKCVIVAFSFLFSIRYNTLASAALRVDWTRTREMTMCADCALFDVPVLVPVIGRRAKRARHENISFMMVIAMLAVCALAMTSFMGASTKSIVPFRRNLAKS